MIFNPRLAELRLKDFFTFANGLLGLCAIWHAAAGSLLVSCAFIAAAVLLDWLDGKVARLLSGRDLSNDLGKELDSLADMVSFGAAPAFLVIRAVAGLENSTPAFFWATAAACSFYFVAGMVRLALFNLQAEKGVYTGLPIPLAALYAVMLAVVLGFNGFFIVLAPFWMAGLAAAMVAKFKIDKHAVREKLGPLKILLG